jgi:hypothetical protein
VRENADSDEPRPLNYVNVREGSANSMAFVGVKTICRVLQGAPPILGGTLNHFLNTNWTIDIWSDQEME